MPAKVPDRALRLAYRRPVDLVEQHHDVIRRFERCEAAPAPLGGARKLPCIEIDRGMRIGRVQMQVMKFRGRQHVGAPLQRIWATMRRIPVKSIRLGETSGTTAKPFSD